MQEMQIQSYRTLTCEGVYEFIEKKSRFIGYAAAAMEEHDALDYIATLQQKHADCSCICYGYISGLHGTIQRFHDGHEPVGGMPILDALKKQDVTGAVCAVVRYFGGVKLGAGPLARAFGRAGAGAIDRAMPGVVTRSCRMKIEFDYSYKGKIDYYMENSPYILQNTAYLEQVIITVLIPYHCEQQLTSQVQDICSGKAAISCIEEFYRYWE